MEEAVLTAAALQLRAVEFIAIHHLLALKALAGLEGNMGRIFWGASTILDSVCEPTI